MIKIFGKLKLRTSLIALQKDALHPLNVTMNNLVAHGIFFLENQLSLNLILEKDF
jgi:hypothetical protein